MRNLAMIVFALTVMLFKISAQSADMNVLASSKYVKAQEKLLLVGEWGHYVTEWTEKKQVTKNKIIESKTRVLCYACPTIIFRADSTGLVKFPDDSREEFKWRLINNKLTVLNTSPLPKGGISHNLADGIYKIDKHQAEKRFVEIALINSRETSYILRK